MKPWISGIGVVALCGIVGAMLFTLTSRPHADEPAGATAAPAPSARTSAPPRPTRGDWSQAPTIEATAVAEPAAAAPTPPPPPAPEPAEVRDHIDQLFYAEAVDAAWNQEATWKLEKAVPALLPPGSVMRRVECRSSMCRIESSHANIDQFGIFVRNAFMNNDTRISESGFFAGILSEPAPGQPVVTVAYMARKGHAMPSPERMASMR
jgi:hypothetical protein